MPAVAAVAAAAPARAAAAVVPDEEPEPAAEDPQARVGSNVGEYTLLELKGQGGMGWVYRAVHRTSAKQFALKMLRRDRATDSSAVRRFFAEARAMSRIAHENILAITEFAEAPGGDNYYVSELLDGQDLRHLVDAEKVMPLRRTLEIARQIASAMAAAHGAGIIHRDLKPENVFVTRRSDGAEIVKLLDFGVAKLVQQEGSIELQSTASGAIIGTPEYMSPEQASGQPADHRSDIYSFGVILYELVTGKKPFQAKHFGEMVIKHLTIAPPAPRELEGLPHQVPPLCDALVMMCLSKEPDERPQSMAEIEHALREIASELPPEPVAAAVDEQAAEAPASEKPKAPPTVEERIVAEPPSGLPVGRVLAVFGVSALLCAGALWGWRALHKETTAPAVAARVDAGPAAVVEPPRPSLPQVAITFVSTPPGMQVYRSSDKKLLGTTPFTASFDQSREMATFEFHREGRRPAIRQLTLEADARLEVSGDEEPAVTSSRHHSSHHSSHSSGQTHVRSGKRHDIVLDPFAP